MINKGDWVVYKFNHNRLGTNNPYFDVYLTNKRNYKTATVITGTAMDSALINADYFALNGDTFAMDGSIFNYKMGKRMNWRRTFVQGIWHGDSIWEIQKKTYIKDSFPYFEDFSVIAKTGDSTWLFADYPVYSIVHPAYNNKYFSERKFYQYNYATDSLKVYAAPLLTHKNQKLHEEVLWEHNQLQVLGLYKNPEMKTGIIHGVYWSCVNDTAAVFETPLVYQKLKKKKYVASAYMGSSGQLSYNHGEFVLEHSSMKLWEQESDQIIAAAYSKTGIKWAYVFDNYCNTSPYPVFVGQKNALVLLTYSEGKGIAPVPGQFGAEKCNMQLTRVGEDGKVLKYKGKALGTSEEVLVYPHTLIDIDGKSVGILYADLKTGALKMAVFSL